MKNPVMHFMFAVFIIFLIMPGVLAQENSAVPTVINYQGYLTDKNGSALDGSFQMTFRLYEEAGGSKPWIWQEVHQSVVVEKGLFNILIGSIDTLQDQTLKGDMYLEIKVGNEPEMTPRLRLASVAYSFRSGQANNSELLDHKRVSDFVAVTGDTITGTIVLSGPETKITTDQNEHMALMPNGIGNVGIGTNSPAAKLDVNGGIYLYGAPPFIPIGSSTSCLFAKIL